MQPGVVLPGSLPRLVLTDNPRLRTRPVPGGRIPRTRGRRNQNIIYPFEMRHYHRPGHHPDEMSQYSGDEVEEEEEDEGEAD